LQSKREALASFETATSMACLSELLFHFWECLKTLDGLDTKKNLKSGYP
jgi:hypothetical protein